MGQEGYGCKMKRRTLIQSTGALVVAAGIPALSGCSDDAGFSGPPLPTDLPKYVYDGPLGPETLFQHGVASGDPTADAVILWTRVSPATDGPIEVFYEVAVDDEFKFRVAAGTVRTSADTDYTVKLDVTGLIWGRDYWYRFWSQGRSSIVGKTRLAPAADSSERLRFAVTSCASYAHGYFHAYRWMAARADLDCILQLGDYIYEYGNDGYGSEREYDPPYEVVTLSDYRRRYAHYRKDPDLQLVHARHPFIPVWDDHETADNAYAEGAENHQPESEGAWADRLAAARQAYFEWMPIRDNPAQVVQRAFRFGNLVDLLMLDTRNFGRSQQIDDLSADSPERSLLGAEQEAWLAEQLRTGTGRWKLIGQQVVFGPTNLSEGSELNVTHDDWQGYPAARTRMVELIAATAPRRTVILTGDIHSSWALETALDPFAPDHDPARDNVAVEFVCPGVTSPGFASEILAEGLHEQLLRVNPHLKFVNMWQRGYFLLTVDAEQVQADWYLLDGVEADEGNESWAYGVTSAYDSALLVPAEAPAVSDPEAA